MLHALIPAAGHSTRMGQPKLALPLGDQCVLERMIHTLKKAEIAEILVVIGPHVAELAPIAENAGARVLILPQATPHMRATVERGLTWLEETHHAKADDAWLLVPADHPTLDANAVRNLVTAYLKQSRGSIAVPTFTGKRGHPAIVAWKHVAGIRAFPSDLGLNAYLRQHAAETLEVPVNSDSILLDLDTPADYKKMLARFSAHPHADG